MNLRQIKKGVNMMNDDILYAMKLAQIQRAIGELKALTMLYYEPLDNKNENYHKIVNMVIQFENNLTDNFG